MRPARSPPPERLTRSSTRSQTQQSRESVIAKPKHVRPKGTGRIGKLQTNATEKPKPKARSKPKIESPREDDKEEVEHDVASPSVPDNVTIFTITSDLVKKPITCHQYTPTASSAEEKQLFIFTHGAGGTLSAPAVVHFSSGFASASSTPLLAFQGSMNLGARVKGFHACYSHTDSDPQQSLLFGGRSMGARAAVIAATEHLALQDEQSDSAERVRAALVLVSYPLQGPKDVRDQILVDLPEGVQVLFITGERDAMCPLALLEETRARMRGKSRVVVVRDADHGMNVRPKGETRGIGEETGKVAAKWLKGEVSVEGEVIYLGEEEGK